MRILTISISEGKFVARLEANADQVDKLTLEQQIKFLASCYERVSDALDANEVDIKLKQMGLDQSYDVPIQ